MNIKKFIKDYITSWFVEHEFDYNRLLTESPHSDIIPLRGAFDWGAALGLYWKKYKKRRTLLAECLYRFKYWDEKRYGDALAKFLNSFILSNYLPKDIDLITTVPVTITSRQFQTMFYIIECVEKNYDFEYLSDLLIRIKNITAVKEIKDTYERKLMSTGKFTVNEKYNITNKTILLVDDIYDSGTTLDTCVEVLKNAGANQVIALVLVTTDRRKPLK